MKVLNTMLLPLGLLFTYFGLPPATSTEITYKMLAKGCEARCNKMHPRPAPTNKAAPTETTTPFLDYDDVKKFSCLEACRMAITVYPKSDDEIRRYDIVNKNKSD